MSVFAVGLIRKKEKTQNRLIKKLIRKTKKWAFLKPNITSTSNGILSMISFRFYASDAQFNYNTILNMK